MSDDRENSRLPPPAFPPGSRRHLHRNSTSPKGRTTHAGGPGDDAFIMPDDPLPERRDTMGHAIISPDDPIPERAASGAAPERTATRALGGSEGEGSEQGVVTGMSFDAHVEPEEMAARGDPHVMEVIEAVGKLAEALRRKGEAGLRAGPEMSRFDATLRAYCIGYLAGRRAEDNVVMDVPDWGEAMPDDA